MNALIINLCYKLADRVPRTAHLYMLQEYLIPFFPLFFSLTGIQIVRQTNINSTTLQLMLTSAKRYSLGLLARYIS